MSHFYGTLKGDRGEVTRRGTRASGISASAQSYNGSVTVSFTDVPLSGTRVTIRVKNGSEVGGYLLWAGPLSDLLADKAKLTVGGAK